MSSYDTGESYMPPIRSIRRDPTTDDNTVQETSRVNDTYNVGAPLLISLGGGLTPSRIVKKLPEDYESKTLLEVVKYMISPDNLSTNEETSIAEAVKERMNASDYRGIVNNRFNYHNDRLRTEVLKNYLIGEERETEGGPIKFNKADLAIVSHDEGGTYQTLDKLLD